MPTSTFSLHTKQLYKDNEVQHIAWIQGTTNHTETIDYKTFRRLPSTSSENIGPPFRWQAIFNMHSPP